MGEVSSESKLTRLYDEAVGPAVLGQMSVLTAAGSGVGLGSKVSLSDALVTPGSSSTPVLRSNHAFAPWLQLALVPARHPDLHLGSWVLASICLTQWLADVT